MCRVAGLSTEDLAELQYRLKCFWKMEGLKDVSDCSKTYYERFLLEHERS